MSSEFLPTKLGEVLDFANGKTSPERSNNGRWPVYGSNGIIGTADATNSIADTIVIGRVGSYCGSVYLSPTQCWVTDNAIRGTAKGNNSAVFLFYLLKHLNLNNWRSGSGQPLLNQSILNSIDVYIPEPPEQQEIGTFLSCIDDRIALLRETNATLEAIAQALFKSWFVDFDPVHARARGEQPAGLAPEVAALFPDRFEESELGMVPKGWRTGAFRDVCVRIESGGTPRRSVPEYWGGGVSWLSSGEVRSPIVFDTKETITDLGVKESAAKLWPQGTTVVAMYGATAGEVCLLARPTTANQACCGLIAKPQARAFMFMCARRERAALASKSSGSAQQNLNKGLIESHPLVLPPIELLSTYEESAGALLDCWIANDHQAQTLANLRDTLLPRLISGQLRLPDAEQQLKDLAV
ncbi:restriction endonuclease subunit S [Aeromonas dhakensis]|uniref:restriction endonuclease subunit S n=1 Tax=Aeromonas dhakensis TaxID=196024 RepID=UPI0038D00AAB